ncbi:MAG: hypothetical protein QG600_330 [Patescibacteria group bacterium]|jgi:ribosomal protein S18 acetylase RimI-like enzyme|nr:hypothetical protein [Patescibacteria group bacterium]
MSYIIEEAVIHSEGIHSAVVSLTKQLDAHASEIYPEDLKDIISSPTTYLFLAKDTEKAEIIGMITLVTYRIPYKKKGVLEDLVVDEHHRGKGLGEALVKKALEKAKELQITTVDLTSRPDREGANRLYQKMGFEKRETNVYRVHLTN